MSLEETIFPIETDLYIITEPKIPTLPRLSEYYQFSAFLDIEFAKKLSETHLSKEDYRGLIESGRKILEDSALDLYTDNSSMRVCYYFKKQKDKPQEMNWLLDSSNAHNKIAYKNRNSFSLMLLQRDYDKISKDIPIKGEKTIEYMAFDIKDTDYAETIIKLWRNWVEIAQTELK